ncbi:NmrA family NAD(P)-binding protein [Methyloradius palustris]|uniref:NmrA-like domain-containing protein n=1 Tax=Methyloradius palustris TaxID=2778876 RepID=A0A8D5G352_9PROT|nr:NmrA family NAD(P)-binding protein [Methyloradius palustris]BCM25178.1 hypothetical protein ZMTM_14370 [Methyloradius palustris]
MYAITGITGQVGTALANVLLDDNQQIRAIVRSGEKGNPWKAKGAEVAIASMEDQHALADAFKGVEAVFILLPPYFDPAPGFPEARALISNIKQALDIARPNKVVCLSTIGSQVSQPNLLNQLGIMEKELSTLSIPITFLRAAWFMENAAWDVEPAKTTGTIPSFLQPLDRKIPMIATADIGTVAAKLLQQSWNGVRIVELQGPELVSPNDIAAAFAQCLDKSVVMESVPRANWEGLFKAQGMQNPTPRIQMLDGFNEGWIKFEGGSAEQVNGQTSLKTVIGTLLQK